MPLIRQGEDGDGNGFRRQGEAVILEPVKPSAWPAGLFDKIRIHDPAFARSILDLPVMVIGQRQKSLSLKKLQNIWRQPLEWVIPVPVREPLMSEVTRILSAIEQGDPHAAEQLLPLIYQELRRLAAQKMAHEPPGQTLQATALVHEAYLRLIDGDRARQWSSRGHFFAAAAEAMRRILIDQVRHKRSQRQGGARRRCELSEEDLVEIPLNDELIDLDEALAKLAATDPQAAELVKLRVFAGMTIDEVAQVQGISPRTVKRNWAYARAWLGRELAAYDQGRDQASGVSDQESGLTPDP